MSNFLVVDTKNDLQYVFMPISSSSVRLKVKAANDAHIAFTNGKVEKQPMTELRIGGWGNTRSSIRRDRLKPDKVEGNTPGILNRDEYVGFWIRWYSGYIAVGFEDSKTPFMAYKDPSPHHIDHMAVRTGWGATGSWRIEVSPIMGGMTITPKPLYEELRWVEMSSDDELPPGAVVGGFEKGEMLYIGRGWCDGCLRMGKYVPSAKHLVICWMNRTYRTNTFEMLCGHNFMWVSVKRNEVPPNVYPSDVQVIKPDMFIGRVAIDNDLIPGTVDLRNKICYIPYHEAETPIKMYDVMVIPEKMLEPLKWHAPKNRIKLSLVGREVVDRNGL